MTVSILKIFSHPINSLLRADGHPKSTCKKLLCTLYKKVFLSRWHFPSFFLQYFPETFFPFHWCVTFVGIYFHPGRLLRTTQWACMAKRRLRSCPRGSTSRWVGRKFWLKMTKDSYLSFQSAVKIVRVETEKCSICRMKIPMFVNISNTISDSGWSSNSTRCI